MSFFPIAISSDALVHLSLTSHYSRLWPHLLCNEEYVAAADVSKPATCLRCIAKSMEFNLDG